MPHLKWIFAAMCAALLMPATARAQDCYLGEIRTFVMNWCPVGFAATDGSQVAVQSNPSLFSLLGTTFGGNGSKTFALPDLRGRSVIGAGSGPGLTAKKLGERGGQPYHALTADEMPAHSHSIDDTSYGRLRAQSTAGTTNDPAGGYLANSGAAKLYTKSRGSGLSMHGSSVSITVKGTTDKAGSGDLFSVQDPFLAMTQCICTSGQFPPKN